MKEFEVIEKYLMTYKESYMSITTGNVTFITIRAEDNWCKYY